MEERKMVDYKAIGARVKYYRKKKQITHNSKGVICHTGCHRKLYQWYREWIKNLIDTLRSDC